MERPNRIANAIGGTNVSIGPVVSRPVRPSRWPSCTTMVSTPNPTSAERIVVIAAVSEITIERKAIVSTRKVMPMM